VYVGFVLKRFAVCRVLRAIIGSKRDILFIHLFIYLFIFAGKEKRVANYV
jgi:hypothetical protein